MIARHTRFLCALCASVPLLSGCYNYTRVPVESVPIGESVRMIVNRAGASEVASVTGSGEVAPTVEGQVTGREGDNLLVRVPVRTQVAGGAPTVLDIGQVVRVPTSEVLAIDLKRLSPAKTGFLVAGSAAALAGVVIAIIDAGRGDVDREQPDPDVFFNILSIPIG